MPKLAINPLSRERAARPHDAIGVAKRRRPGRPSRGHQWLEGCAAAGNRALTQPARGADRPFRQRLQRKEAAEPLPLLAPAQKDSEPESLLRPDLPKYQGELIRWVILNLDPQFDSDAKDAYEQARRLVWYRDRDQVIRCMAHGAGLGGAAIEKAFESLASLAHPERLRLTGWLLGMGEEKTKLDFVRGMGEGKFAGGWRSASEALRKSSVLPFSYEVAFYAAAAPDISNIDNLPKVRQVLDYWELAAEAWIDIVLREKKTLLINERNEEQITGRKSLIIPYVESFIERVSASRDLGGVRAFVTKIRSMRSNVETTTATLAKLKGAEAGDGEGQQAEPPALAAAKAVLASSTEGLAALAPGAQEFIGNFERTRQRIRKLLTAQPVQAEPKSWWQKGLAAVNSAMSGFVEVLASPASLGAAIQAGLEIAGSAAKKLAVFGFTKLCELAGIDAEGLMATFAKAGKAFERLRENPGQVFRFLGEAIKTAFGMLKADIGKLLLRGLVAFLAGAAAGGAGVQPPKQWNLKGIVGFFLQLAGVTFDRVRGLVVKLVGKKRAEQLEMVADEAQTLLSGEQGSLVDQAQGKIEDVKQTAFGAIKDWVVKNVIGRIIPALAAMFVPAAALYKIVKAIWSVIQVLNTWASQIKGVIDRVFESLEMIVEGKVKPAAQKIYDGLADILPVAIDFMAGLLGLGKLGAAFRGVLKKIGDALWRGVTAVVTWVVEKAKGLFGKGNVKGKEAGDQRTTEDSDSKQLIVPFLMSDEPHEVTVEERAGRRVLLMRSEKFEELDFRLKHAIKDVRARTKFFGDAPALHKENRKKILKGLEDMHGKVKKHHENMAAATTDAEYEAEKVALYSVARDLSAFAVTYALKDFLTEADQQGRDRGGPVIGKLASVKPSPFRDGCSFTVHGTFAPKDKDATYDTRRGEYRQELRGTFKHGDKVLDHPVADGLLLHETAYREDATRDRRKYGYRHEKINETSEFRDDDGHYNKLGNHFFGTDAPSPGLPSQDYASQIRSGDVITMDLQFRGKLVDVGAGAKTLDTKYWTATGEKKFT